MQVQVEYGLTGGFITIHRNSIASVCDTFVGSYALRCQKQVTDQCLITVFEIINCRDVLARNYEYMGRRLRIDIAKSDSVVRLKNNIGRYVTGENLTKQAV